MHDTPVELQAASLIAAATIYSATLSSKGNSLIAGAGAGPSDDNTAASVAELAEKILDNFRTRMGHTHT